MDIRDLEALANPNTGLVPMRMASDDVLPYLTGEIAGFRPEHAFAMIVKGHAAPLEGDIEQVERRTLNRALAGEGVAGTTLMMDEALRSLSARELDELVASGRHPLHLAATMRSVPDASGRSGSDQSGQMTAHPLQQPLLNRSTINSAPRDLGLGGTGADTLNGGAAVEIPEDWSTRHHLQRVKLAGQISGESVGTAADADRIIAAEVERRGGNDSLAGSGE